MVRAGLAPTSNFGCASSVGGGFRRSEADEESILPFRLLGSSVFEMRDGEWNKLYVSEASNPACLYTTLTCQ